MHSSARKAREGSVNSRLLKPVVLDLKQWI